MRYSGGLLGSSWLTALTSDVGAGTFDSAGLVQNFENQNPANTLWSKPYNLYSKIDTEVERCRGSGPQAVPEEIRLSGAAPHARLRVSGSIRTARTGVGRDASCDHDGEE